MSCQCTCIRARASHWRHQILVHHGVRHTLAPAPESVCDSLGGGPGAGAGVSDSAHAWPSIGAAPATAVPEAPIGLFAPHVSAWALWRVADGHFALVGNAAAPPTDGLLPPPPEGSTPLPPPTPPWTPGDPPPGIPEPAVWVLLVVGATVILAARGAHRLTLALVRKYP